MAAVMAQILGSSSASLVRQPPNTDEKEGAAGRRLAGFHVEFSNAVIGVGAFHGEGIPLPFHRLDVKQDGLVNPLGRFKRFGQILQIMPVDRPEIMKTHLLKHGAVFVHRVFQGRFHPDQQVIQPLADKRDVGQEIAHSVFEADIPRTDAQMREIPGDKTDVAADGHAVVVEHDDEPVFGSGPRCLSLRRRGRRSARRPR